MRPDLLLPVKSNIYSTREELCVEIPEIGKFTKREEVEEFIRGLKAAMAENQPRDWTLSSYNKQTAPDHPRHGQRDEVTGRQCKCEGKYTTYKTWILMTGRGFGKDSCRNSSIPTPGGWVKLGDIQVGDLVFDEAGKPVEVEAVYDRIPEACYRLTFSDGAVLDVSDEHLWTTWTHAERKAFLRSPYEDVSRFPENWPGWRLKRIKGPNSFPRKVVEEALRLRESGVSARKISEKLGVSRNALRPHLQAGRYVEREAVIYPDSPGPQVRTTQEIVDTLTFGQRGDTNHCIPVCGALQLPEACLPVDPYALGYWL